MTEKRKAEAAEFLRKSKKTKTEKVVKEKKVKEKVKEKSAEPVDEKIEKTKQEQRKEQKELREKRRMTKKHYPVITKLKMQWEELRKADITPEKTKELLEAMMKEAEGKIEELVSKHDASRVIQSMLKRGTTKQREIICTELLDSLVTLSKDNYGKFLVLRMLKLIPSMKQKIVNKFHGHVSKLVNHVIGCSVIEAIYESSNAKDRHSLIQELYHPQFRALKTTKTFAEIFESVGVPVKERLLEIITTSINKGTIGDLTILQKAVLDYISIASEEEQKDVLLTIQPEAILHTKEGSKIAMKMISIADKKERKKIAKKLKPYQLKIVQEEFGHHVAIQFIDTVDDIVLIEETFFNLDPNLLEQSKYMRRFFLFALVGRSSRHFPPGLLESLNAIGAKDPLTRYTEVKQKASAICFDYVLKNLEKFIDSSELGPFAVEVLVRANGDKEKAVQLLCDVIQDNKSQTLYRNVKSIVQYQISWRKSMGKAKVIEGYTEEGTQQMDSEIGETCNLFATLLLEHIPQSRLVSLATSDGVFLAIAFCELNATKEKALSILKPHLKSIMKSTFAGADILTSLLQ